MMELIRFRIAFAFASPILWLLRVAAWIDPGAGLAIMECFARGAKASRRRPKHG